MGSKLGALKVAASRIEVGFDEYMEKVNSGLKWCWKCESWKPKSEFSKDKGRGDSLKAICRDCAYVRKTPGPIRRKRREMKRKGFSWCRGCKEWLPSEQVHQGACQDCHNREARERYTRDKEFRMERRQHAHSRKRNTNPIPVIGQQVLLEEFNGKCAYCGAPAETWDHIVPISKGGETKPYNIVPACASCNSSKKDKDLFDWLEEKGFDLDHRIIDRILLEHH